MTRNPYISSVTTVDSAAAPRPAASPDDAPDKRPEGRITRLCDELVDLAVVVLASWTVVYHLCLVVDLGVATAVALEAAVLLGWATFRLPAYRRAAASGAAVGDAPAATSDESESRDEHREGHREGHRDGTVETPRVWRRVTGLVTGSAVVTAVLMAIEAPWPTVAALWLVSSLAAVALTWRRLGPRSPDTPVVAGSDAWVALGWATALAALSIVTLRPNPDDLYYVNLSQWVAEHGTFPTRDTIFSDLVYPMSSWPPMASYDGLAGAAAHLLHVHAGWIVYVVVPPVATFLAVLALWRLLRAWRVRPVTLALSVALVFLLLDAAPGYATPGNLFLTRLWQGKVILLCLMIPVLLVYALRYLERPTRARAGWLFAGGAASVGLSTTAIFLVPLVALAGAAPLLRRRPRLAWGGFAAMAAYPLAAGAVTMLLGGRSADDFSTRRLYRFDPSWFGHEIFQNGTLALVAVSAVLLGALLVPHRGARLTTALLVLFTGITFVPGVTHVSYDLLGLGPTLWRVSWVATIAALVGVLAAAATRIPWRTERIGPLGPRSLRLVGPAALLAALVLAGVPIWSERAGVGLAAPPHWQRGEDSMIATAELLDVLEPGDIVLAPPDLGVTIAVTTTRVKTVAPRKYFMDYLSAEPGFDYQDRELLMDFVDPPPGSYPEPATLVRRAVQAIGVEAVCVDVEDQTKLSLLTEIGFRSTLWSAGYACVRR